MTQAAFYLPIAKIDREKRLVYGYASTPTLDLDGEVVEVEAIKKALPDYMEWANIREMHEPSAVGVAKEANVDEKGLYIGAKIVDDDAWKKVIGEVYKGFSIGGSVKKRDGNHITALDLVEISLVDRPANPDCKIEVIKAAGISEDKDMADLSAGERLVPPDPGEVGWLRRMVEKLAGGGLAKEANKEPHGHVAYADPGYQPDHVKRYPIDTEEHIRAAWNYIHQERNAAKYSPAQAARVRRRIIAAWKAKIDPKGPPEAEDKAALDDESDTMNADQSNLIEDQGEFQPEHLPARGDGFSAPAKAAALARSRIGRLAKGMSVVQTLACVADMLECAEDCLRAEGGSEHGDPNDYALADCVCDVRCDVLDVIAAKAVHEKDEVGEASEDHQGVSSDVSDILDGADKMADPRLTKRAASGRHHDHLVRAHHHVSEAHRLLAKLARAKDGRFEAKAAHALLAKEASDALDRVLEHHVLAMHHIRAAAGEAGEAPFDDDTGDFGPGQGKTGDVYHHEEDIEGVPQRAMTEGSVDDYAAVKPYPGKAAHAGTISKREAEAIAEAAFLKGKLEALEAQPASPKARLFAVPRGAFPVGREEEPSAKEKLLRGVNLDARDAGERQRAAARMLGNMVTNPGTFARPVIGDATFKGAAAS